MQCPKCKKEFDSDGHFRAHLVNDHNAPREIMQGDQNLLNVPPGAQVISISPEQVASFDKTDSYVPVTDPPPKKKANNDTKNSVAPTETKPKNPEPIELHYTYSGNCPDCGNNATTLLLEVKKELHAIAYCVSCKKNLSYKRVKPL